MRHTHRDQGDRHVGQRDTNERDLQRDRERPRLRELHPGRFPMKKINFISEQELETASEAKRLGLTKDDEMPRPKKRKAKKMKRVSKDWGAIMKLSITKKALLEMWERRLERFIQYRDESSTSNSRGPWTM